LAGFVEDCQFLDVRNAIAEYGVALPHRFEPR
jgi:hypothetical protein